MIEPYAQCHYKGDRTGSSSDLIGKVMGPTTTGELMTCYAADYDAETDITTAHFRPTTMQDVEAMNARS